jgi:hypothetical protein
MRSIMEFNENGEVTTVHGVFLKGKFSLKDDLLTLQLEGDAEPFDIKINLTKDNLTITDFFSYENVVLMRKQLDTRSKTSIIGDWNGEDKYKGVVSYTFTVDGQFYYRKPMPGYTVSRFIVKGDTIETTRDGEKEQMKWSIIGDKLKLIYDGKEYILLRAH